MSQERSNKKKTLGSFAVGVIIFWCSVCGVLAQPATSSNRFLFIVDVSAGMKPFDKGVRDSVFDLIFSGVRGALTNGDTYGLWLVNDRNDTSFPMELWKLKFAMENATKATLYVKSRGFKGKPGLNAAFADAARVVENVKDLTVILISNGETPIHGTPFDEMINDAFLNLAPAMRRNKATLNTTLSARDGKFVGWAVNSPDFLVVLPEIPKRVKLAEAPVVRAKTNSVAASTNVTVAAPAAPAPLRPAIKTAEAIHEPPSRVTAKPIIITRESVAQEQASYHTASSSVMGGIPDMSVTNGSVAGNDSAARVPSLPGGNATYAIPRVSNGLTVAEPLSIPLTNLSTVSSNEAKLATNLALAPPISATNSLPATVSSSVSAPPPASASNSPGLMFWLALALAAAAGATIASFFMIFLRSRKHEPSLISRAAARERMSACQSR